MGTKKERKREEDNFCSSFCRVIAMVIPFFTKRKERDRHEENEKRRESVGRGK